ncbi:hypothetical protein BDC45DRAFT_552086 [Circinella umbellata]|nr:hypothetical protein BDC45DRAFT_552086 [Circinella umbellata]
MGCICIQIQFHYNRATDGFCVIGCIFLSRAGGVAATFVVVSMIAGACFISWEMAGVCIFYSFNARNTNGIGQELQRQNHKENRMEKRTHDTLENLHSTILTSVERLTKRVINNGNKLKHVVTIQYPMNYSLLLPLPPQVCSKTTGNHTDVLSRISSQAGSSTAIDVGAASSQIHVGRQDAPLTDAVCKSREELLKHLNPFDLAPRNRVDHQVNERTLTIQFIIPISNAIFRWFNDVVELEWLCFRSQKCLLASFPPQGNIFLTM